MTTSTYSASGAASVSLRRFPILALMAFILASVAIVLSPAHLNAGELNAASQAAPPQSASSEHEAVFTPGPSFNVGEVSYPSAHDFDPSGSTDTCLSISVPPGDTFTLSLTWEAMFDGPPGAGDLDLYLYNDSNCTASALLTSSFNSNAYTGELLEITPQVRNIGPVTAIAGIRIGRRSGRGNPGLLRLSVLTGAATFVEHGTDGPPLQGPPGAPSFTFTGPFTIAENSSSGTIAGTVSATDPQSDAITFFELEPAAGQTSFQIHPVTGAITVEDPAALDREVTDALIYWIGVTDGFAASVVSVSISLTGVNDITPVAQSASAVTSPGVPIEFTLVGVDDDIDPVQSLEIRTVSAPSNGSLGAITQLDGSSVSLTYTPDDGFTGVDTFSFEADDGDRTSLPAVVTINVTDQPPSSTPGPTVVSPTPTPASGPTAAATSTRPSGGNTGGSGSSGGGGVVSPPSSTPGVAQGPVQPPSTPRSLRAEPGDTSVTITWQRPISDGGSPIEGYRVFNVNTAQSQIYQGDITSARVFGLENETAYLFQVRAFNSAGMGESGLVGPVTPISELPSTIEVQSSLHLDDSVSVWWAQPFGPNITPISEYRIWLEGGDLVVTVTHDEPLITNVKDLMPDAWHAFRVTGFDEDGEVVASGVTEPIYLPPTLASLYEPLPADAILVDLSEQARTELHLALQAVAGPGVLLPDSPVVLTVGDEVASLFLEMEELHRGIVLPDDFMIDSDQMSIRPNPDAGMSLELELTTGLRLTGKVSIQIDPTGILFEVAGPVLTIKADITSGLVPVTQFELELRLQALSPDFMVDAMVPIELPLPMNEALAGPFVEVVTAVIEIRRSGLAYAPPPSETVRFLVEAKWHHLQVAAERTLTIVRHDSDGTTVTLPALCESTPESTAPEISYTSCEAVFDGDGGPVAHYALISGTAGKRPVPTPTPAPTPLAAPSEPPAPTAVSGPLLVVVEEEPTVTPQPEVAAPSSQPGPEPRATPTLEPTPAIPVLPESGGGGTSMITWLMSGLLGLVILRGAFYAVGRIRS